MPRRSRKTNAADGTKYPSNYRRGGPFNREKLYFALKHDYISIEDAKKLSGNSCIGAPDWKGYQDGYVVVLPNGDLYDGEWSISDPSSKTIGIASLNGKGIYYNTDGRYKYKHYEGQFKDNACHGDGVTMWRQDIKENGIDDDKRVIKDVVFKNDKKQTETKRQYSVHNERKRNISEISISSDGGSRNDARPSIASSSTNFVTIANTTAQLDIIKKELDPNGSIANNNNNSHTNYNITRETEQQQGSTKFIMTSLGERYLVYIDKLREEGYDSIEELKYCNLEELITEVGMKKGHAKRLLKFIGVEF